MKWCIASRGLILRSLVVLPLLGAACSFASELRPHLSRAPEPVAMGEGPPAAVPKTSADAAASESIGGEDSPTLLDAWTLAKTEDGASCRADLTAAGFEFRPLPDKDAPDKSGCGIPHAVVLFRGPTGITYEPAITVDCSLARALGSVERIVQEEAEIHLGQRITKIGNFGAYACRPRNSRKGASLSAHAFGSAVDISAFHPTKGQPAIIVRDYADTPKSNAGREARQRFLRGVYGRLRHHEADLTYAVGPDFNASHRDHFHLDRGGWHFWFNR